MYFTNLFDHLETQRKAILHFEIDIRENYLPLQCKILNLDHIKYFSTSNATMFECKNNSEGIINFFLKQKLQNEQFIALISGFKGCGKSMTARQIELYLWQEYCESNINIIPIILLKIENIQEIDKLDLLEYTLQTSYSFTEVDILKLKEQIQQKSIQLVFIIDQFELEHVQKLNIVNYQNTWGNSKIIIMIKEVVRKLQNYASFLNYVSLQLQILPFSQEQVREYLNLHFYQKLKFSIQNSFTFSNISTHILDEFIVSLLKILKKNNETQWNGQLNQNQLDLIKENIQNLQIISEEEQINELLKIIRELLQLNWSPIYYKNQILKLKLDSLSKNPAILKILIDILPQLEQHKWFGTFDFYEDFLLTFLGQEQQLFHQQQDQQNYVNEQMRYLENKYFEQIFGNNSWQNQIKNVSLLEDYLDSFSKVEDYFIAKFIHNLISLYPSNQIFSDDDDYCLLLKEENKNLVQNSLSRVPEIFYLFGKIDFSKQFIQLGMKVFKQKFVNNCKVKAKLINMIKASSVIDNYEQIAGNAFYVLKDVCSNLENQYFANIRIIHSNLQNMTFTACEFSGSKMNYVDISSTHFIGCGMNQIKWQNMITSFLKVSNRNINQFQIIHDEKILAIIDQERQINFLYLKQGKNLSYHIQTKESINQMASTINGYILAICNQQNEILIWSIMGRKLLRRIKTGQKKILQFKFSKTGKFIATRNAHQKIKVWDLQLKYLKRNLECQLFVFHPNEQNLVLIDQQNKILQYIFKLKKVREKFRDKEFKNVKKIDFSADGKLFIAISDYDINIWGWENEQLQQKIPGQYQYSVTFSFNTKCFARSNQYSLEIFKFVNDKFILKHKITNPKTTIRQFLNYSLSSHLLLILEGSKTRNQYAYIIDAKIMDLHNGTSTKIYFQTPFQFSQDNNLFASGGNSFNLFNQENGELIYQNDEQYDTAQSLAFSNDGLMLAIALQNQNVHIINARDGKIIAKFEQKSRFSQVQFSDDNQFLAIASLGNQSRLWEYKKYKSILVPSTQSANQITFLGRNHLIAICNKNQIIHFSSIQNNKELCQFQGSKKQIQAMSFSFQSQTLVVGGKEKELIQWNIIKQKLIRKMNHHKNYIYSLSFSFDGNLIASGSDDSDIILWDNKFGKVHRVLIGHRNSVLVVTFKKDEEILASGSMDKLIIIWNTKTGQQLKTLKGHQDYINCLTFSPVDRILVSGGNDKQILFWDINQLIPFKKMQNFKKSIKLIAFSSNSKKLAICNEENLLSIWKILTKNNNYSISLLYTLDESFGMINAITFSPDCQSLFIGGDQFQLVQWKFKSKEQKRFEFESKMNIFDLVFTKDGTVLVIRGYSNSVYLFNVQQFTLIKKLSDHETQVKSIIFTPNDQYLVSSSQNIISWDINSFEQKQIISNSQNNKNLKILGFILNGKILVFVSQKLEIQKINFTLFPSGEIIKSIIINGLYPILSPNGAQIALLKNKSQINSLQINSQNFQKKINQDSIINKLIQKKQIPNQQKFNDINNNQIKEKKFKNYFDQLQSISSTLDGEYLSTLSQNGMIYLYQTFNDKFIRLKNKGDQQHQWRMQFSPNNKLLLFYSLNKVFCYDLEENTKRGLFQKYHGNFYLIIFSQNDNLIATLYRDIKDFIILWNLQDEKPQLVIEDYSSPLTPLVFSPDGQSIVSGSTDSSIYFFDIQKGEQTVQLDGMNEAAINLCFSQCGKYLISQDKFNKLYLWNVDQQLLLRQFEPKKFQIYQFLFKSFDQIYLFGIQTKTIFLFDLQNDKIIQQLQYHSDIVQDLAISTKGCEKIVSISQDSTIRIWNLQENKLLKKIESSKFDFVSQSSYDQKLIAIENQENQIKVWDTEIECLLYQLEGHYDKINVLVFSLDSTILVSGGSDNTVIVWNLQDSAKKILKGHTDSIYSISISANNKIIASGSRDTTVRIYKLDEENHSIIFKGHNKLVSCLQFSNDGNYLASGSYDYSVILWNISNQQLTKIFKFHESKVISVKFSPKDCFIISESEDESQITWNIQTGQLSSLKNSLQEMPLVQLNKSLQIQKSSLIQAEIYSPNQLDIIQFLKNVDN